jgi:hypothetical protein
MFNRKTGKFEYRRFYRSTNHEVVGSGDSPEEARKDYKRKLDAYREKPLLPTGEFKPSPGFVASADEKGRVSYVYNPDRKMQVFARPELAETLRKERETKEREKT